ncbi:MAG: hypothetical protein K2X98_02290, partial [Alphaproteobacteria bacterium]|nr:hypothetical protein [Alphaproteobacteria bacterium]
MTHFYKKFLLTAGFCLLIISSEGFSMQPAQGQIVPSKGTAMTAYHQNTALGSVLRVHRGREHMQLDGEAISSRIFRQSIQAIFKKTTNTA